MIYSTTTIATVVVQVVVVVMCSTASSEKVVETRRLHLIGDWSTFSLINLQTQHVTACRTVVLYVYDVFLFLFDLFPAVSRRFSFSYQ